MALKEPGVYSAQLEEMRTWATDSFKIGEALASGMMTSHFSTVFFGPEGRLRFAGVLPFGDPYLKYYFYFYPKKTTEAAICAADMVGNLADGNPIKVTLPTAQGFTGTIALQLKVESGMKYIVATTDFKYQGETDPYKATYYLLTLGPNRTGTAESAREKPQITGFLPF